MTVTDHFPKSLHAGRSVAILSSRANWEGKLTVTAQSFCHFSTSKTNRLSNTIFFYTEYYQNFCSIFFKYSEKNIKVSLKSNFEISNVI